MSNEKVALDLHQHNKFINIHNQDYSYVIPKVNDYITIMKLHLLNIKYHLTKNFLIILHNFDLM